MFGLWLGSPLPPGIRYAVAVRRPTLGRPLAPLWSGCLSRGLATPGQRKSWVTGPSPVMVVRWETAVT